MISFADNVKTYKTSCTIIMQRKLIIYLDGFLFKVTSLLYLIEHAGNSVSLFARFHLKQSYSKVIQSPLNTVNFGILIF